MQSRSAKQKKDHLKRQALQTTAPDARSGLGLMLAMVGERKKVLDVGCASGQFAGLCSRNQCDVVGIEMDPRLAEEARRFCTDVMVADLDQARLGDLFPKTEFDVVVFGDVLARLREPVRVLEEARALLAPDGFVVASIPNVSHGAIRLALLTGRFDYQELGILDDTQLRFFTAKTVDELLVSAGYRVESVERVLLPIFEPSDLVPQLSPDEFDASIVADVRSDPESDTLQLVLKAIPLPNDQRLHALLKRFLQANTELADGRRRLLRREHELQQMSESLSARDAAAGELQQRIFSVNEDLNVARGELRELEAAYQRLEVRHAEAREAAKSGTELRAMNAALEQRVDSVMERLLAAQAERSREAELAANLRANLAAAVRDREALEKELDKARKEAPDDDRYVAQFESELAAQRRLMQLEGDLRISLGDLERERGRVAALEDRFSDETGTLLAKVTERELRISQNAMQLEHFESQVEALRTELGDEQRRSSAVTAERADLLRELETARVELYSAFGQTKAHLGELEAARAAHAELSSRSTDMVSRIHELEGLNQSAEARYVETRSALEERMARVAELEQVSAAAAEASSTLAGELEAARAKLAGMNGELERAYAGATATSRHLTGELEAERAKLMTLQADFDQTTAELNARNSDMAFGIRELEGLNESAEARSLEMQSLLAERAARIVELELGAASAAEASRNLVAALHSELEVANDREAALRSLNDTMAARVAEAQAELDGVRTRERSLEAGVREALGNLRDERALRARLEVILAEQQARFLGLEERALRALEESEATVHGLEEAWFAVYAELEELRSYATRLAISRTERTADAEALDRKLAVADSALETERRDREQLHAENAQARETLATTHSALRESRERVGAFAAEIALLKVRAVRAEQAAEEAAHAHQLAFREQADRLDAARKTALAERIVMRDYAEEIRRDGAGRASAYETRLGELTGEVERAVQQLRVYEAQLAEAQLLVAERDELRDRVADTERLLLDQAESVMATMQAESAQLALLIDTVQSSHFWRLKRWLSRLVPRSRVRVSR